MSTAGCAQSSTARPRPGSVSCFHHRGAVFEPVRVRQNSEAPSALLVPAAEGAPRSQVGACITLQPRARSQARSCRSCRTGTCWSRPPLRSGTQARIIQRQNRFHRIPDSPAPPPVPHLGWRDHEYRINALRRRPVGDRGGEGVDLPLQGLLFRGDPCVGQFCHSRTVPQVVTVRRL